MATGGEAHRRASGVFRYRAARKMRFVTFQPAGRSLPAPTRRRGARR